MHVSPLASFIIKVFLWLPVCYWGWYALAGVTTSLLIVFVEPLLTSLFPDLIAGVDKIGNTLEVIANVSMPNMRAGVIAELPIPINPLVYSYGFPLALALTLAAPFNFAKTSRCILVSIVVFLMIQVAGVYFQSLKVLFLQTAPELIGHHMLSPWQLDAVGLGYQASVLIMPAVAPIIIWVSFYHDFLTRFIGQQRKKKLTTSSEG